MSDSNRIKVAFQEEDVSFGTVPTGGSPKTMRLTGESLGGDVGYIASQELRSDRQVADRIRNSVSAAGDTNFEFSIGPAFDELLKAALLADTALGSQTVLGANETDIAVTGGNAFTRTADYDDTTTAAGDWVKVSGFATAGNNGWFKIASATAKVLTVANASLTNEGAGPSVSIDRLSSITNGITFRSYAMEREYEDLTNTFERFSGMVLDGMSLNVQADQIITGAMSWLGKLATSETSNFNGTPSVADTGDVLNAIDNVGTFFEGGGVTNDDIISVNLALANNHRQRQKVGTLGAFSVGTGTIDMTGSLQAYFENATLFSKYLNGTATSLAYVFVDTAGSAYVFDIPQLKFTSGRRVGGGINQDVIADLQWGAYRHPTELITIRVAKWTAP